MSYEERRERLGFAEPKPRSFVSLLGDREILVGVGAVVACGALLFAWQKGMVTGTETGLPRTAFTLPPIEDLRRPDGGVVPGLSERDFLGQVTVVNVWAAWCGYCRGEHSELMSYSKTKTVRFVGVNYRDDMKSARDYLAKAGIPYDAVGFDPKGAFAGRLGIRGVPTTLVIDREGRIAAKLTGGLDPERIRRELTPAIQSALARQAPPQS